jgi:23S rRNA (cytosine1962-C5)-methyltransferase
MDVCETAGALALADPWPSRVRGGTPSIELGESGVVLPDGAVDGQALQLTDAEGAVLGVGLVDLENRCLRLFPLHEGEPWSREYFRRRVRAAFELRQRLGLVEPEGAFRWINGEGDGLSGFLVDYYARYVVVYSYSEAFLPYARWIAESCAGLTEVESVLFKIRPTGEPPAGRQPFQLLVGSEAPAKVVVQEDGAKYEVHLAGGLNTGLFCDMRGVRRSLRYWATGKRVLNTFCYTGSLSVVCALAGAKRVVSVDFAAGVLQWAKTNFFLNDLAPDDQRFAFTRADVFDYLKAERRKERHYDVVILDPPATTGVPGRRWYLKSDYDRLIGHALRVLSPGGLLVVAASSAQSRPEGVESQIRAAARDQHRQLRLVESHSQPPDFPTQMIHPQGRHLKCYFLIAD